VLPSLRTWGDVVDRVQEAHMAKKPATKKTRTVTKSADDGQFKSAEFAKKHPKSTYKQTVGSKKSTKK
jgi:hypothetical protein